jgi:hypothetical protein
MAHNRRVELAREAEHLRRCDQSLAYKRVYQRWQQTMAFMGRQQAQLANTIQEAMNVQRVSDTVGNIESQTVRHESRPDPLPPPAELQRAAAFGNPLSAFVLAALFMSKEQWEQIPEDVKAMAEMHQVNEEYDRQLIRLSGWEW